MAKDSRNNSSEAILSPIEAAYHLGITPELLFAYARYFPKKHLGHKKNLNYLTNQEHEGFRKSDLNDFDVYLQRPWSENSTNRPDIPKYIVDYLKVECRGKCARCENGYKLENAHIIPYAETQSHHHHNLIRLCSECHEKYDAKPNPLITRQEIQALKDQLVSQVRESLKPKNQEDYSRLGRLPSPASKFIGREHEVGVLVEALQSSRSLIVQGPPGIGKTQLLLNALQRISDECSIIWIACESYSNVSELEMALKLSVLREDKTASEHSTLDSLCNKKIRIVFDGVEQIPASNIEKLENFFNVLLETTVRPQFIFTSQVELYEVDIEHHIRVEPLDFDAGMLILRSALENEFSHSKNPNVDEQLQQLVNFCDGHPLSLRLINGLIRYFKSPRIVIDRIHKKGLSALKSPTKNCQTTNTSLRACLLVSYQNLTSNQRRILWFAAHCPAGLLVEMLHHHKYEIDDIENDIAVLQRWHLLSLSIDHIERQRLRVLSPIARFIETEWSSKEKGESREMHHILVEDFASLCVLLNVRYAQGQNSAFGLFLFDQELPNFVQALRIANSRSDKDKRYLNHIEAMASSMMIYCFSRGLSQIGVQIMRLGANAALEIGHIDLASDLLLQLFCLAQRTDDFDLELLQNTAVELSSLAEDSVSPRLLANASMARGELAIAEKQFDEALNHFSAATLNYKIVANASDKALKLSSDIDFIAEEVNSSHQNLALALRQQGFAHEMSSRPEKASFYYEQALQIFKETNDEINMGPLLHQIGNCAVYLKQFDKAFEAYIGSSKSFYSIGMSDFLSNSLSELGHLLVAWYPVGSISDFPISEKVINEGLLDTKNQVKRTFYSFPDVSARLCTNTVRKMFGMISVASLTRHTELLAEWSCSLRESFSRSLIEDSLKLDDHYRNSKISLIYFDLTLALAGSLSELERLEAEDKPPLIDEIEYYASLCYQYSEYGWQAFRPFEWLAAYLHHCRGLPKISSLILIDAIVETEEYGKPFSLEVLRNEDQ